MSEDYQHACERAELLGLPRPSEEEWRQSLAAESETRRADDDDDGAIQVIALRLAYVKVFKSEIRSLWKCDQNSRI